MHCARGGMGMMVDSDAPMAFAEHLFPLGPTEDLGVNRLPQHSCATASLDTTHLCASTMTALAVRLLDAGIRIGYQLL